MTPLSSLAAHWPALSALLDEALALPMAERAAWLDRLDAPASTHRDVLRELLGTKVAVETNDFLAELPHLPASAISTTPSGAVAGAVVGPWRLLSELGRGGMGVVWLAERADGMLQRRVALKLPHVVWGDAFAERLVRERAILSSLEHPHIARLYDANVDALGRPFFAMEYVEGMPIDQYCRTHDLSLADRMRLLLQVMSAVAHAHTRLVVHRDLKPGNILVTEAAQVRLLDFGIAKLLEGDRTEDTALTALGGRALTPDYASPEQIRGEPLGTASDIYGMGVVAYELLTGTRPYRLEHGGAGGLEAAIAAATVPRASDSAAEPRLRRQLRGDLDAILNKALKQRPAERYATMDAFAEDLRRWQTGAPVRARPDTLAYRVAKVIGHYRLQVAVGTVVVAALIVGASLALWQAQEARRSATLARSEAATATAVQGFIESVFDTNSGNQADPAQARKTTAEALLDRGAERIDKELAVAPAAQLRLYGLLGEMYEHMAQNEKSVAMKRRGLALATRLHGKDSPEALGITVVLAKSLAEMGQHDASLGLLNQADASLHAQGDRDQFLRMVVDSNIAAALFSRDTPRAYERARSAAAIARRLPTSLDGLNALDILGETAYATGHLDEARAALVETVAAIDRQPEQALGMLPSVLSTLGEVQGKLGHRDEAEKTLRRALAKSDKVGDPYSTSIVAYKLSRFELENGLLHDALQTTAAWYAWARSVKGNGDYGPSAAMATGQHGRALVVYGDAAQGLRIIDEARTMLPEESPDMLGPLLAARAEALLALKQVPEACELADRAVQLVGADGNRNADMVRWVRRRCWVAFGEPDKALKALQSEASATGASTDALETISRQVELATTLWAAARWADAATAATNALAAIDRLPERRYALEQELQGNLVLGEVLVHEGRPAQAAPLLDKALQAALAQHDPQHSPVVAEVRRAIARSKVRVTH